MARTPILRSCTAPALVVVTWALCGCSNGSDNIVLLGFPETAVASGADYGYAPRVEGGSGTLTFELVGPAGMTVSATGRVDWSPSLTDLGTYDVTLTVTDEDAETDTQTWVLRVHQGIDMGVALSPRGHTGGSTASDFVEFYENEDHGRLVAFHIPWRDSLQNAGNIPGTATSAMLASSQFGFTPVIGFGWTDGEGNPDLLSETDQIRNSWDNSETRLEFLQMVEDFAALYRPPYLFLGNETNIYFVTHTQDEWDDWISQFTECYDAIKAVSPDTTVYTTFQLERMKGLGVHNGWSDPPHFELIADHSGNIDAIAFTSYPYFEYDDPADIPSDHYNEILDHWDGPVGFSEIGWLSSANGPYPGSEEQQTEFLAAFFAGTTAFELNYVVWLFLHDFDQEDSIPAFAGIGLRDNSGDEVRTVDGAWQGAVDLRER